MAPVAPVTWRDGVHLTGTPIWCDARRRRDVCFVSSVDRGIAPGAGQPHGQLIATPITLALLGAESGQLGVPIHRPFTLGTTRLELIPSGRGLGAAALHVSLGDRTVLYAGEIRTRGARAVEKRAKYARPGAAEVRACDAVVVAAPFGGDRRFAPIEDVASNLIDWVRVQLVTGRTPVLVVDTVFDGLEVAEHLVEAGLAVAGSRSVRAAAERVESLASVPAIRAIGKEPAPIIRLDGDRLTAAATANATYAMVSIRALDEQHTSWDATFAWPFVADTRDLLAWIEQSRARHIYVTGAGADAITDELGPRARVLGPPRQMALFGS